MRSGLKSIKHQQKQRDRLSYEPDWGLSKLGNNNFSQYQFELMQYGGEIKRTVMRKVHSMISLWEEISFATASLELKLPTAVYPPEWSELAQYEGRSINELMLIDGLFYCPWFAGALSELLDAGCQIRTSKATYKIGQRLVEKGEAAAIAKAVGRVTQWQK